MHKIAITVFTLLALTAAPCQAQLGIEDANSDGVLNPSDFSFRYYVDHMDQFPDRVGLICVSAYELDKTGDHKPALALFKECAERGNPPAMINLASMYELGYGTPVDLVQSTRWLRRAAEAGYTAGQYHYGMALLQGKGTPRDPQAAREWLQKAAAQGDSDAKAALADNSASLREPSGNELSYDSQIDSTKRLKCLYGYAAEKTGDHDAARRIFEDCIARWNDVFSMIFLAEMYETAGDAAKATALMKRGANTHDEAGYSRLARYHYGVALYEGHGTAKNMTAGRRYLVQAAKEGVQEAADYLATHGGTNSSSRSITPGSMPAPPRTASAMMWSPERH